MLTRSCVTTAPKINTSPWELPRVTDKNLQDGKKYTYKVRGYYKLSSGAIYGTYSAECTGITIADTIENFAAAVTAPTSVKLSWSPIPAATGYRVYRSNGSSGSYETIATTNSPDDSHN